MIKFICVTEVYNNVCKPLVLNVNHIRSLKTGNKNKDTMIQCDDIKFFFVKETVEEIWAMLK